jgi:hypothetical protein
MHHGVFSRDHARQSGFSAREINSRLRGGLWVRLHQCAFRDAAAPLTWKGELLAACWAGGFRAYASHRSAAALHGLAGGRRDLVEITCPRWRRSQHEGLIVHETKAYYPSDLTFIDHIPVSNAARTLLDLGGVCGERTVELALDRAVREELTSLSELDLVLRRLGRSGRPGVRPLRALLVQRGATLGKPESEMETRMLQVLRENGLPEPALQFEVRSDEVFVARVDAAFPQWRIAIEYDSDEHHAGAQAHRRDSSRRNRLWRARWSPITATADDIRSGGAELCAAIRSARRFGVSRSP